MAEAQDTPAASPEPSMEEILASIRKIISDESPPPAPAEGTASAEATDVIELTQMVQDDGSVVDLKPAPPPEEPAMPDPAPAPPAPAARPAAAPAKAAENTLVSEPSATAAVSAMASLASTVEIERLASAPQTSTFMGNGTRTLEDMVLELMRPLLKEWLDKNLPATVDRLVQKEIERISKRAQD